MTVEDITLLAGVYFVGAVIISLLAAFWLDLRLRALLPANRPYLWGFFFGSICFLACFPLAALSALEAVEAALGGKWAACQIHEVHALVFALNALCGWFIVRRKGWAWTLGTLLGPISAFPVFRDLLGPDLLYLSFLGCIIWPVNYTYGRNRWAEIHSQAAAPAPAAVEPPQLLAEWRTPRPAIHVAIAVAIFAGLVFAWIAWDRGWLPQSETTVRAVEKGPAGTPRNLK